MGSFNPDWEFYTICGAVLVVFFFWIASLILRKRDLERGIPAEYLPGIHKSKPRFRSIDEQRAEARARGIKK